MRPECLLNILLSKNIIWIFEFTSILASLEENHQYFFFLVSRKPPIFRVKTQWNMVSGLIKPKLDYEAMNNGQLIKPGQFFGKADTNSCMVCMILHIIILVD